MPETEHELPEQMPAARDDLAAPRPDRTPPFAALKARRRRRDARRGGAAIAATAVAVVGVALVPTALTGGDGDPGRGTQVYAAPSPSSDQVEGACAFADAGGRCSDGGLPPHRFVVRYDLADADDDPQLREPEIARCLALPGVTGSTTQESNPPTRTVEVQGDSAAFLACARTIPGVTVTAEPGGGPPEADSTRYGVGVGWGDDPAAYDDAAEAAVQRCFGEEGLEDLTTLTSRPPSHSGTITGRGAAGALQACVAEGAPGATVFLTPLATAAQQTFIRSCVGAENALAAPGYVGRTEAELDTSVPPAVPPRLVGRDGTCLGRSRDLREDRVNLIVEDGIVIWAGRF